MVRFPRLSLVSRSALLLIAAVTAMGCSDDEPIVPEVTSPPLEVVEGAPQQPSVAPPTTEVTVAGYVLALDGFGGDTIIGTTAGASLVSAGEVVPLEIWDDQGIAALDTGRVTASVRRQENVLLAGANGLFHTVGKKLVPSPATSALADIDVRVVAVNGTGVDEVIWLGATDGLYRHTGDSLERWTISGESAAPTALWADTTNVFVAYGATFYRLDIATRSAVQEALDFGAINGIDIGAGDLLYLATDNGLFERNEAGAYRQFTLSSGDTPALVDDLVFDAKEGTFAVTSVGMVRLSPDADPEGVATLAERIEPRVVGADDFGVVWVGDGEKLTGLQLGTPLSFATDVSPIFGNYCMNCHAAPGSNNAPPVALDDYAIAVDRKAEVVQRVGTGQMPPASAPSLPADQLQLLLRWYASGANP